MNVEFGMRNVEKEMVECLIVIFSAFRIPTSEFLIPIIAAFNPFDDSIFQSQVVHEAAGTVIVSPFLDNDQLLYAIGLSAFVIPVVVLIILINSIIARMMLKAINPFLLPDLDMVRFAAFGQHPGFKIADGNQADAAPEAGCPSVGKSEYR